MPYLQNKNLYGNHQVYHPDGYLMFRCNAKRAKWYVDRNLAVVIQENPPTIQLTFTPNGRGNADDPFYSEERVNQCVVCGTEKKLTKHHCVPRCYRSNFPESIKSRSCHDIVLLCEDCHHNYESQAFKLKMQLAIDYGLIDKEHPSLSTFTLDELRYDQLQATGIARTLIKHRDRVPFERQQQLIRRVQSVFGSMPIEEVAKIIVDRSSSEVNHGKLVVDKIEDIADFIYLWRKHFVDTMNPKFLPNGWDVNHKLERIKNETIY